jgi:DNA polymerase
MKDKFFIDYETFWDVKYSLRTQGMSYTDFILDDRFQIHGASVAVNKETPFFLKGAELGSYLEVLSQRHGSYLTQVSHNTLFDGFISRYCNGASFTEYFCTLAMIDAVFQGAVGRGLDECMKTLLGREGKSDILKRTKGIRSEDFTDEQWTDMAYYANEDVAATQDLYYGYAHLLPELEHKIMDIVLKMFIAPELKFDDETLRRAVKEADDDRDTRIQKALDLGATEAILKGNKLFPAFLKEKGIPVPMKPNPKGELIPAFAKTDVAFQEMLESEDPTVNALANGRLAVKSTQATTRAYRFLKLHEELNCFPVAYNYARAHTWRVSGANKYNPANLKRGSLLRLCIVAPRGKRLGVSDASQIECRSDGYIAGQESLMQLFRDKEDPYNAMASDIFSKPIDRKGNPDHFFEGFIGKTAVLGLGFQMGGDTFKWTVDTKAKVDLGLDIDFDLEEAHRIVQLYRQKNWKIETFWSRCKDMLYAMVSNRNMSWNYPDGTLEIVGKENKIYFPNGTWLYYPMLDYSDGSFTYMVKQGPRYISKYIYGGLLCENIIQHFARNITSAHMVQINERYKVVMHTYDENVALIPESEADEGTQWMIDLMKVPPSWAATLPLDAEGGHAKEYSK